MAMREDCKHFQSRTYDSGEVARFCVLDLAPEAPWRCPESCPRYERRLVDATFEHGNLVEPSVEVEPDDPPEEMIKLLGEAEDIVESITPEALDEIRAQRAREDQEEAKRSSSRSSSTLGRLFRRRT